MALGKDWKAGTPDSAAEAVKILESVKDAASAIEKLRKTDDKKSFVMFLFQLRTAISGSDDFAEAFLAADGLDVVSTCLNSLSGNMQAELLKNIRELLLLENAIDQFTENNVIVDRIYKLLVHGGNIAKQALEILIVTVGTTAKGLELVHNAAMKTSKDEVPYATLTPLLQGADLTVISNLLTFLNITLTKVKGSEALTIQDLVAKWKRCGLLAKLEPLNEIEDDDIKKQLTVFQKLTGYVVPLGWYAVTQYRVRAEEIKKKHALTIENLAALQATQSKALLVQGELAHVSAQLQELRTRLSDADVQKLLAHGVPIVPQGWDDSVDKYAHDVFKTITTQDTFKKEMLEALKNMGSNATWNRVKTGGAANDDVFGDVSDMESSEDSDYIRYHTKRMRVPSSDSSSSSESSYDGSSSSGGSSDEPPPSDGSGPPSDDAPPSDDDSPPDGAPPAAAPGAVPAAPGAPSAPGAAPGAPGGAPAPPTAPGAPPPPPGAGQAARAPGAAAPAPGAPKAPAPPRPKPGGKAVKKKELKLTFYKGAKPTKKMRVMHWDKVPLYEGMPPSLWHTIHPDLGGTIKCGFDYEEFENMFSQKEKKQREEKEKVVVIEMIEQKKFQNLSIMLHKMPSIPELQRAIQQLDSSVVSLEMLEQILGQMPNAEDEEKWRETEGKKPVDEYEPPEQFFAMVFGGIALTKRLKSWQITLEWMEKIAKAERPIMQVQDACDALLNSKHLPLVLGIVLGFGNYMNAGHAQRGNACGFSVTTLSKLELTKDVTGKQNLLQYVVQTCNKKNPDSITLPDELAAVKAATGIKGEDMEKAVDEVSKELAKFKSSVHEVKTQLESAGVSDEDDPYVKRMSEFFTKAQVQAKEVEDKAAKARATFAAALGYWPMQMSGNKTAAFEDYFPPLLHFLDKFAAEAGEILKERKRLEKAGKKLKVKDGAKGEDAMAAIADSIKQDLVES